MGWEDASHFINQITESATLLLVRIFSRKKLVEISILPTQAWGVGVGKEKEKEKNTGWVSELKIAALFLQELLTLMITFSDHLNARVFYIYKPLSCCISSELEGHKTLL